MEPSQELANTLDNPLTQNDLPLRLRCLVVKGDVDLDFDTELAERDWTEALSIATKLNDPAWINRANGELGIIAFLHGDSRTATLRVAGALMQARKLNDVGAQIRYLTLFGNGLVELQRSEQSLGMFDEAIGLAKKTPGLGEPVMAHAGKATALVSLNRLSEARGLLDNLLDTTSGKQEFGYESEALEQLAKLEVKAGQAGQAVVHLRKAVEVAAGVNGYRLVTDANLELSRILLREKRLIEAEKAALGAVAASRKIGDKFLLPRALAQLASVEGSRSRFRDADRLFEEATYIVNGMLANTASANARAQSSAPWMRYFLDILNYRLSA
jgi:tetratricopeptide (TPR) repeat protein